MNTNAFALRHIGPNETDQKEMLDTIGVESIDQLIKETIPAGIRLKKPLDLEEPMTEHEYLIHIHDLSKKNKAYKTYIGLGYHPTILPAVIQRNILENPGWYTAYTPYQAEIAQGRLEALLNFQTMITDLTGMEIANASLLDESTAAAEAMSLLYSVRDRDQKKNNVNKFFVCETILPQTLSLLKTRSTPIGIELVVGSDKDFEFTDDFFWASTELYLATNDDRYKTAMLKYQPAYEHKLADSWKNFVRNVGFHSLLENRDKLDQELADQLVKGHTALADGILQIIEEHPYRIALNNYEWGSNSDILNQAYILCVAHRLTGEEKYLLGAEQITDYIFGKNATGYSFMTGFGAKKVMFPHHRPSGADSIADPVPGFIIGGPNDDRQDAHDVKYTSEFPAKAYMDVEPSFASNEVCINWNAPAVYVLAYLEEVRE